MLYCTRKVRDRESMLLNKQLKIIFFFVFRFVKSFSSETNVQKNLIGENSLMSESIVDQSVRDGPCYTGNLLPEMDIFSAG